MNEIYEVTDLLIQRFKLEEVHTVTYEKTSEIDFNKHNIYPLVNLDMVDAQIIDGTNNINYVITVVQQRDWESVSNNDKLLDKDNLIDNLGETHRVLQRVINGLRNNHNKYDIDIINVGTINFLKNTQSQDVDGVRVTLTMTIGTGITCDGDFEDFVPIVANKRKRQVDVYEGRLFRASDNGTIMKIKGGLITMTIPNEGLPANFEVEIRVFAYNTLIVEKEDEITLDSPKGNTVGEFTQVIFFRDFNTQTYILDSLADSFEAYNGLNIDNGLIKLGGELSEDTSINTNGNEFKIRGDEDQGYFGMRYPSALATLEIGIGSAMEVLKRGIQFFTGKTVIKNTILEQDEDRSVEYTDRSLVDKQYTDSVKQTKELTSRTLTPADNCKLIKIKANVTLTVPNSGLPVGFNILLKTFEGFTLTIVGEAGVNFNAPNGLVLRPNRSASLIFDTDDNICLVIGETTLT